MVKLKNINLSKMSKNVTLTSDSLADKSLDDVKSLEEEKGVFPEELKNMITEKLKNIVPVIMPGDLLNLDSSVEKNFEGVKLDEEQKKVR